MLSNKFICKYMRMAKQVGEDANSCYSRKIGTVLVRVYPDGKSKVVGTGYNSPPAKTPHCDTRAYLQDIVWPQLTMYEQTKALKNLDVYDESLCNEELEDKILFVEKAAGCGKCPRKLIGAASGERLEICSCVHSESNAIVNSTGDLWGAFAFCWCGVACFDCTKLMINAGIKRAFFLDDGSYATKGRPDYSFGSRWLFEKAGVEISLAKPEYYLEKVAT